MNLYIVSTKNYDYDEFDSFVVAAKDEVSAKNLADNGDHRLPGDKAEWEVECIGTSNGEFQKIIHESYNAG